MSDNNLKELNTTEAIILNSDNNSSPTLNDILTKENTNTSTTQSKTKESQTLSLNILNKNSKTNEQSSSVIQIPQSFGSDDFKKDINIQNEKGTLDEAVCITISRDVNLIFNKLKYVINPFISKQKKYSQIRQWDLWGPLILNLILAFTLTLNTKEKGQITSLIFIIFWLGGSIIYLNNHFLGVKASIFQLFCLLGYCLFPLNIAAIIVTLINLNDIIRLIIVIFFCIWAIYSSGDYLKVITTQEQRYLVLYPCILFYVYISWFVFATKQ